MTGARPGLDWPPIWLCLAFLGQNVEEVAGGGPPVPRFLEKWFGPLAAQTSVTAVILISLAGIAVTVAAARANPPKLAMFAQTAFAAGLAANAPIQLALSLSERAILPGTISGVLLMLPFALLVLVRMAAPCMIGSKGTIIAAFAGFGAMPLVLAATWILAAVLMRALGAA